MCNLNSLEEDEARVAGVAAANRLIRESNAPDAVQRAAMFLLGRDAKLPQAEKIPFPPELKNAQARFDAQWLAVSMLGCDMRGGCGPGGFFTAMYCGRNCRPGHGLEQAWRREHSPQTIAYARALAAAIKADRASSPSP